MLVLLPQNAGHLKEVFSLNAQANQITNVLWLNKLHNVKELLTVNHQIHHNKLSKLSMLQVLNLCQTMMFKI